MRERRRTFCAADDARASADGKRRRLADRKRPRLYVASALALLLVLGFALREYGQGGGRPEASFRREAVRGVDWSLQAPAVPENDGRARRSAELKVRLKRARELNGPIHYGARVLPEPADAPPRPDTPGYAAYLDSLSAESQALQAESLEEAPQ